MSAEFNWWLLIVGVVAGGALTWLVLADSRRREDEIADEELTAEAGWIARILGDPAMDADRAERVLRAHRRYLGFPPPDPLVDPTEPRGARAAARASGDPGDAGRARAPTGRRPSPTGPEPAG